jgi:thymidylate synthase ThyX
MSEPQSASEPFSPSEREILRTYFTNIDEPVFALRNLPETVKGAMFARYSRSQKSLRRLFLDEFYKEGNSSQLPDVGGARATELYERILTEFGDDSVAQLGGAHLAVEQASNILTKSIEWSRLGAYLEQSTRYISYDTKLGGRWRYLVEPRVAASPHADHYRSTLDAIFQAYSDSLPAMMSYYRRRYPQQPGDSDRVWRSTIKAKAFDALRGMLPAATISNVGIFASGQTFENMLIRMNASPLAEVRSAAAAMLRELDKVIPEFVQRVELPDRGGSWTAYLRETGQRVASLAAAVLQDQIPEPAEGVTLVDWDPKAEEDLVAAILYSASDLPELQLRALAAGMSGADRLALIRAYVGDRRNRRHKPGRAFERVVYRFDLLADYGAFRDLQRHRMLTIEWQPLRPLHGYVLPNDVVSAGLEPTFRETMERSEALWSQLHGDLPDESQYAVCFAHRVRSVVQLNAREAMHLIELRSSPQGHVSYRTIAQEMWRQIRDVAGHRAIAGAMTFVDFAEVDLERLQAERRAEGRRQLQASRNEP